MSNLFNDELLRFNTSKLAEVTQLQSRFRNNHMISGLPLEIAQVRYVSNYRDDNDRPYVFVNPDIFKQLN